MQQSGHQMDEYYSRSQIRIDTTSFTTAHPQLQYANRLAASTKNNLKWIKYHRQFQLQWAHI